MPQPNDKFSKKIFNAILHEIATTSNSIYSICNSRKDFPNRDTFYTWLHRFPECMDAYCAAKAKQQAFCDEHIKDLEAQAQEYIYVNANDGCQKIDNGIVSLYKMKVDNMKWMAARLMPNKWGDKVSLGNTDEEATQKIKNAAIQELRDELMKKNEKEY